MILGLLFQVTAIDPLYSIIFFQVVFSTTTIFQERKICYTTFFADKSLIFDIMIQNNIIYKDKINNIKTMKSNRSKLVKNILMSL